jgi:hypothetical protein
MITPPSGLTRTVTRSPGRKLAASRTAFGRVTCPFTVTLVANSLSVILETKKVILYPRWSRTPFAVLAQEKAEPIASDEPTRRRRALRVPAALERALVTKADSAARCRGYKGHLQRLLFFSSSDWIRKRSGREIWDLLGTHKYVKRDILRSIRPGSKRSAHT